MPNKKKQVPTNTKTDSKAEVQLKAVSFTQLWGAYPAGTPYVDPKTGDVPKGFENQCAVRMSVALHRVGLKCSRSAARARSAWMASALPF
ncbi:hypothetical protein D9M68_528680 [compost metagenome]